MNRMAEMYVKNEFMLCPKFEKTFAILGKKWNGLIIDVLIEEGPQRFVELARKIPDVSDRVLAERLKELEKNQIIQKSCCDSNRSEYSLTEKGVALERVMQEIHHWGEEWLTIQDIS